MTFLTLDDNNLQCNIKVGLIIFKNYGKSFL